MADGRQAMGFVQVVRRGGAEPDKSAREERDSDPEKEVQSLKGDLWF